MNLAERNFKHGDATRGRVAPEYRTWSGMIKRCHGNDKRWRAYYRDRGIIVCERWRGSYVSFLEDMGRKPTPQHTLDRINNDGNYEPGNCRWALRDVQARNRRGRRLIEFRGRHIPVSEAAEMVGLTKDAVYDRLKLGWSEHDALFTPMQKSFGGSGAERFSKSTEGRILLRLGSLLSRAARLNNIAAIECEISALEDAISRSEAP